MGRRKKNEDDVEWKSLPDGKDKYDAYMKSDEWKKVRLLVLERDGYVCRCCNRNSDQTTLSVHHSTYKALYNETEHLEDLITLCRFCHSGIHRVKSNINRFKRPKN